MHLTRIYVERFRVITPGAVPRITVPRLLKGIGSPRSQSVGTRSICRTERCRDGSPGKVLCGKWDVGVFFADNAEPFE